MLVCQGRAHPFIRQLLLHGGVRYKIQTLSAGLFLFLWGLWPWLWLWLCLWLRPWLAVVYS